MPELEAALAKVLEGTTPEWQGRLAELLHELDTYESFGHRGLLVIVDAEAGTVVKKMES